MANQGNDYQKRLTLLFDEVSFRLEQYVEQKQQRNSAASRMPAYQKIAAKIEDLENEARVLLKDVFLLALNGAEDREAELSSLEQRHKQNNRGIHSAIATGSFQPESP